MFQGRYSRSQTMEAPLHQSLRPALEAAIAGDRASGRWPINAIKLLMEMDYGRYAIPLRHGGFGPAYAGQLYAYRTIARISLSAALILTQRDAACELIAQSDNPVKEDILPKQANGSAFTTVGISQLTTSRLGPDGLPKLRAVREPGGFRLTGRIPWVTGAAFCDVIVAGAVLDDGSQILLALPVPSDGVTVCEPFQLMALSDTCTAAIDLDNVFVDEDLLLRGPAPKVLAERSPVKGMTVTAVGIGLADALAERLQGLIAPRREAIDAHVRENNTVDAPVKRIISDYADLAAKFDGAVGRLAVGQPPPDDSAGALRPWVNAALVRLAVAHLNVSKGGGFVAGHDAERLLREAMFFQVWSSPAEIQAATLSRLS